MAARWSSRPLDGEMKSSSLEELGEQCGLQGCGLQGCGLQGCSLQGCSLHLQQCGLPVTLQHAMMWDMSALEWGPHFSSFPQLIILYRNTKVCRPKPISRDTVECVAFFERYYRKALAGKTSL